MDAPIEREDVLTLMRAIMRLESKVDDVLFLLGEEDGEEEEEDDA